jgi:formyl-CoA transferase
VPFTGHAYFTMLNSNKRSLTLNTKTPEGKEVLEKMIRESDVMVENFGPGVMDRMGITWEHIKELNPKLIFASVKGFAEGHPYSDIKVYENVAQCAGGSASTTGFWDGPPTISAAALGDSNTGMHLAIGILTALIGREKSGKGQKVAASMQDCVLNLCRVKLRDQQRLDRLGYLEEYPQYPIRSDGLYGTFSDVVPRDGNAGGGGQPGWVLKCKGWKTDPNAYIYFTIQDTDWGPTCKALGKPEWIDDPAFATAEARQPHILKIFESIEEWLADKTKFEAVDILRKFNIPCAPVLSMKEIEHDPALRVLRPGFETSGWAYSGGQL